MSAIPQAQTQAPEFTLPDQMGARVKLSDFRGKRVVLAFYPADWSPVCTSELSLIQETLDDIHDYDAEVIGVSVDSVWSHRAWAEQQHIQFPLLSDFWPHGAVADQYGVFRDDEGISNRALFFLDESGVLQGSWIAQDPAVAPGLNVIFNALEQMKSGSDGGADGDRKGGSRQREELHHV